MTTTFVLVGGSVEDTARALTRMGRCRVAYTASVGDAASPVYVLSGDYRSNHGQVADYRHEVAAWAGRLGMPSVIGWWDDARGWCHTVALPDGVAVDAEDLALEAGVQTLDRVEAREARRHRDVVEAMEAAERERPAREEAMRLVVAEEDARRELYRPLYERALARCRANRGGRPRGDDVRRVEIEYRYACEGYDHDRAYHLARLTRLADGGPAALAGAR